MVAPGVERETRSSFATPSPARSLRAVLRRGLRDHPRAPLSWGLPLGAMCALIVAIYPSIEDSLDELTENYPQSLKDAFGIEDLNTVEAYLDAEMFSLIVPLAIAFFAVRSIGRAISGAEERGYLDTTLAAPISRWVLVRRGARRRGRPLLRTPRRAGSLIRCISRARSGRSALRVLPAIGTASGTRRSGALVRTTSRSPARAVRLPRRLRRRKSPAAA